MSWLEDTKREYLKVSEVREIFSLSRSYVYSLVDLGVLDAIKVNGKALRITTESVRKMKHECRVDPGK